MATISDTVKVGAAAARREAGAEATRQRSRAIRDAYSRRLQSNSAQNTPQDWEETKTAAGNMQVKGGPVLFWLVFGIAFIKDIVDVFSVLLDLLGLALSATVAGAVVGIPLGIFSELLDKGTGIMIDFTLVAYFAYIGGGFALRLVIMSIGAFIDALPFLDVLPLTTVTFVAAYVFGRGVKAIAQAGNTTQKVVKVARVAVKVAKYI